VLLHLGRIPSGGEKVVLPGYRAEVLEMDGLSIERLRLVPLQPPVAVSPTSAPEDGTGR